MFTFNDIMNKIPSKDNKEDNPMSLESPKFELTKSRLDFYDGKPNKVDYDHQCFLAR